eukprot:scaffold150173_cov26-Tisochrysis_lutea.AAC.1
MNGVGLDSSFFRDHQYPSVRHGHFWGNPGLEEVSLLGRAMPKVEFLELSYCNITNLIGLPDTVTRLILEGNPIEDLSGLRSLTKLKELSLEEYRNTTDVSTDLVNCLPPEAPSQSPPPSHNAHTLRRHDHLVTAPSVDRLGISAPLRDDHVTQCDQP